ncbi:uncharacterized protein [Macrobrachium rosenbergii]|uniref:uncharacterized protein n=1 Tax=Macrobrachium rosenbergii TaxID=79674 RepID=UPI0034D690A4
MNINVSLSSNPPPGYTIIQSNQPSILASSPTPTSLQSSQPTVSGGGDVHICGTCSSQYTEIKDFIDHKHQGCQGSGAISSTGGAIQPQISHPAVHHGSHNPVVGMPVGMPHVILHSPSGPPQMYRIVLEPSVSSSSAQGQSILAQALTGAQVPHIPAQQLQHPQTHSAHSPLQHQQENVASIVETVTTSSETTNSSLIQLPSVSGGWQSQSGGTDALTATVTIEEEIDSTGQRTVIGNPLGTSVNTSSPRPIEVSTSRTDSTNSSNMHTEEEDVATFLATQLASQAAPQQNASSGLGLEMTWQLSPKWSILLGRGPDIEDDFAEGDPAADHLGVLNGEGNEENEREDKQDDEPPLLLAEALMESSTYTSSILSHKMRDAAKELQQRKKITLCRADKTAAFVLVKTDDYHRKLDEILSDQTNDNSYEANDIIGVVSAATNATHLQPIIGDYSFGFLNGNVKTHKPDNPRHSIISQMPAPTYRLVKCLNQILTPYVPSIYSLHSSMEFLEEIRDSLFTNVHVDKTIDLVIECVCRDHSKPQLNIPEGSLWTILEICATVRRPLFPPIRGHMCRQKDGVVVGSPLGVLFVNFYMGTVEEQVFSCTRRLHKYARYIDDIFMQQMMRMRPPGWHCDLFMYVHSLQMPDKLTAEAVSFESVVKSTPASRKSMKGGVGGEQSQASAVSMKKNESTSEKEVPMMVVYDNLRKEKECPVKGCSFTTTHNKDLNRHIRKHTGEKPYRCDVCGTCFSRSDKLKVHTRIHTNVKPYWCQHPNCQYRSIDSGSLRKHMRTHTNERPYRCQLCSYSAKDRSQLTVHLRTHTGDTPFHCMYETCSAAFKTSSDLRRHERLHTGAKPYKCIICDYACTIKSNLTVHMKLNHFQGIKFGCPKCDFQGNSRKHLKDHEKSHASILLHCELCEHVSTSTTGLRQHMLVHSQEKPFQCRYCPFTCKTTGNLRYHVRNKHGCDITNHKRVNTGASNRGRNAGNNNSGGRRTNKPTCYRRFKCSECGSGFVREDSWRSHMRQHQKHKLAQAISGKMEKEDFAVVVEEDPLGGVEQTSEQSTRVTTFTEVQPVSESSMSSSVLPSPESAPDSTEPKGNENTVNEYNSYVITIDGISTVFSNPVRIEEGSGIGEAEDQQTESVQVIAGSLLASESKEVIAGSLLASESKASNAEETYTIDVDDKVASTSDQDYQLSTGKVDHSHHLYDLSSSGKLTQSPSPYICQRDNQATGEASTEYLHCSSLHQVSQRVLVDQKPQIETIVNDYQGHVGVSSKLSKPE